MNSIKYIAFYNTKENKNENRGYSLAASTKIDYIIKVLNNIGYKVKIVSLSRTSNNKFYKGKTIKINEMKELLLFPTFPWGNFILKVCSIFFGNIMLFWYLITNTKKNEAIIVYHSLGFGNIILLAKKIKKFKIIFEVEEIYQDVIKCSKRDKRLEYKSFKYADKFIFSTKLLNEKINMKNKPYIITHGTYNVEAKRYIKFDDEKIHVVYAGTFELRKGGAIAAVAAAEFLSEKYHVHIVGFGSEEQIMKIKSNINHISKKSKATVTYDGLFKGEEYIRFIQKCHIGLSTQNPDAEYNNTSFPSKILSYMANGLRVVSIRIATVESSEINDVIYYYDVQDPKEIADTIMKIDLTKEYDSREIIKKLDEEFVIKMKSFLKSDYKGGMK